MINEMQQNQKSIKRCAMFSDILLVKKTGYLNYRVSWATSDTTEVVIKLFKCNGVLTDIDGNEYHTVKIGDQIWTAENIRTTKLNDGTPILIDSTSAWFGDTIGKYCYYNNTSKYDSIVKYGALYNWYVVQTGKIAPVGWHVPTYNEWKILQGKIYYSRELAAQTNWKFSTTPYAIGNDLLQNNTTGFSALPSGGRGENGVFGNMGIKCFWWSTSSYNTYCAYLCMMWSDMTGFSINPTYANKHNGISLRLIKD